MLVFPFVFPCNPLVRSIFLKTGQGGGQRASHNEPEGQWTATDCVYRHDVDGSHAINDKTNKRRTGHSYRYMISSRRRVPQISRARPNSDLTPAPIDETRKLSPLEDMCLRILLWYY